MKSEGVQQRERVDQVLIIDDHPLLRDDLRIHPLTDREFEIYELIGKGRPTRVIAEALEISPKTVDAHRANIEEKLGFSDGAELMRYAVRWVETGAGTRAIES